MKENNPKMIVFEKPKKEYAFNVLLDEDEYVKFCEIGKNILMVSGEGRKSMSNPMKLRNNILMDSG